jgi:hypothetical protein
VTGSSTTGSSTTGSVTGAGSSATGAGSSATGAGSSTIGTSSLFSIYIYKWIIKNNNYKNLSKYTKYNL